MSSMGNHKCSGLPKIMTPPSLLRIVRKGSKCSYLRQEVYFALWFLSLPDILTSCLQAFLCNEESSKCLNWELSFSPYQIAPGLREKLGVRRPSSDISRSTFGEKFVLETLKRAKEMRTCMGGHPPRNPSLNSTLFPMACRKNTANLG